jgi:ribonuclease HII
VENSTFDLEKKLFKKGFNIIIGTDEVGRGPLCGPVVAAAVMLRNFQFPISNFQSSTNEQIFNDPMWDLVRDSKKLSEKQRESVWNFIHENFYIGIGLCDHETIDRINILEASFLSMKKAVQDLLRKIPNDKNQMSNKFQNENTKYDIQNTKYMILVDGNKKIPNFSYEQRAIIGGDKLVKSISAASIVAKVTRDRIMADFHLKYPQYGLDKHKGYGTKLHMDALTKYGPCPIHRKSFAPVKKALKGT